MKLKIKKSTITISYKHENITLGTSFTIGAVDVNEKQALLIAQILFDQYYDHKIVSIELI